MSEVSPSLKAVVTASGLPGAEAALSEYQRQLAEITQKRRALHREQVDISRRYWEAKFREKIEG